eukprot:Hpha_TRINITY_DN23534_c0_g1::TRINITY_DN23534_c0_g1_i1::g.186485::m.186485
MGAKNSRVVEEGPCDVDTGLVPAAALAARSLAANQLLRRSTGAPLPPRFLYSAEAVWRARGRVRRLGGSKATQDAAARLVLGSTDTGGLSEEDSAVVASGLLGGEALLPVADGP